MAKKKFSADALREAGAAAHMQPNKTKATLSDTLEKIGGEVLTEILVDEIENNPMQPRIAIDDERLQELATSIKEDGLITPIAVFKKEEGGYVLKAGQRRWMAHKILKREKIKAIVSSEPFSSDLDKEKAFFEIAMSENLHRDDLDPLEVAISINDAMTKGYYKSADEAAKGVKKSKSFISKLLKVLKLDNEIIDDLKRNHSTRDIETLYLIQKIEDSKKQVKTYYDFVQKKIDRAGVRAMLQKKVSRAKLPVEIKRTKSSIALKADIKRLSDESKSELENELKKVLDKYLNHM